MFSSEDDQGQPIHHIQNTNQIPEHHTFLNGAKMEGDELSPKYQLKPGDTIEIGRRVFQYMSCVSRATPNDRFVLACQEGRLRLAMKLFADCGANTDHVDSRGMTPLFHGCLRGHLKLVEWLVCGAGADLHHMISIGGKVITSGMIALDQGHFKIALFLARCEGWTMLHKAAWLADPERCCEVLRDGSALVSEVSAAKETAMHVATSAAKRLMCSEDASGENAAEKALRERKKESILNVIRILERASERWRPSSNLLFPPEYRQMVFGIMMMRRTLANLPVGSVERRRPICDLPLELWHMILSHIPHDAFSPREGDPRHDKIRSTVASISAPGPKSVLVASPNSAPGVV